MPYRKLLGRPMCIEQYDTEQDRTKKDYGVRCRTENNYAAQYRTGQILRRTKPYDTVLRRTEKDNGAQCRTEKYYAVLRCAGKNYAAQYRTENTTPYYAVLCRTMPY